MTDTAFWLVAVMGAIGWGCFAWACFTMQSNFDRIAVLKGNLNYWRDRATKLQSELLDKVPVTLQVIDPEGSRIVPFRGKIK